MSHFFDLGALFTSNVFYCRVVYLSLQWSVGGVLSKMTGGGGREGNTGTSSMTPAQTLSAIASESPLLSVPNNVKLESEGSTQLQVLYDCDLLLNNTNENDMRETGCYW